MGVRGGDLLLCLGNDKPKINSKIQNSRWDDPPETFQGRLVSLPPMGVGGGGVA